MCEETEDRRRKTEDRGQKAGDRRRKAGVECQDKNGRLFILLSVSSSHVSLRPGAQPLDRGVAFGGEFFPIALLDVVENKGGWYGRRTNQPIFID